MKWLGQLEGALASVPRADTAQTLAPAAQAQARVNIGIPSPPSDGRNYVLAFLNGTFAWVIAGNAVFDVDGTPVLDVDGSVVLDVL